MTRAARRMTLIWCLLPAVAIAAPADPWLRIQSAHFELFTTAGERAGRDLVRHFEQVRSFFLQTFGVKSTNGKPVCIVAFHSEKEFQPYSPSQAATAFYHPGSEHDFIIMSNADAGHYQVATHEYTHLLINQMTGVIPLWLNEGLADLYSTVAHVDTRVLVGVPPPGRLESLRLDRWIDLDALLSTTGKSPLYNEKSHAGMFYAESWALVHMLNLNADYKQHLSALLDALRTLDSAEAFQRAYGKSLREVQADLQAYVSQQYLRGLAFPLTLEKEEEAPAIEAQSAMQGRLALAELQADYPGRLAQAAEAYTKLVHDFPQRWEVEAAAGHFAWRERRNPEAAAHFARAAQLGATDPRVFVDYARALSLMGKTEDAISALRKGIELDASFKEAHYELGLLLVRTQGWREVIAEMQLAVPLKPQWASRYFYDLAYSEYRLGDLIAARNYLEQGRAFIKIPEEVAALDRLSQMLGPPVVEGVLENIECRGIGASVRIRAADVERTFLITDITGAKELECGLQKNVPVRIEFQAMPLGATGADGIVKSLAFR